MEYYLFNAAAPVSFCHAGKSQMQDNWMHYERIINEHVLYIVVNGDLYLEVDGVQHTIRSENVFLMKAGAHHIGWKPAAVTFYWMHFRTSSPLKIVDRDQALDIKGEKDRAQKSILFPQQFTLEDFKKFVISINQLIHYYRLEPRSLMNDYLATFILLELANQVTLQSTISSSKQNRRFEEIAAYIELHSREELKVSDIAQKFNYSEKYLTKLFRTHYHTNIKEFILERRLKLAESLLLSSNDSISVIAKKVGFHDEYYFMRLFKQKVGLTPTHYRNTYSLQFLTQYEK